MNKTINSMRKVLVILKLKNIEFLRGKNGLNILEDVEKLKKKMGYIKHQKIETEVSPYHV